MTARNRMKSQAPGGMSADWGSAGAIRMSADWGSAGAISGPPQLNKKLPVSRRRARTQLNSHA